MLPHQRIFTAFDGHRGPLSAIWWTSGPRILVQISILAVFEAIRTASMNLCVVIFPTSMGLISPVSLSTRRIRRSRKIGKLKSQSGWTELGGPLAISRHCCLPQARGSRLHLSPSAQHNPACRNTAAVVTCRQQGGNGD